MTRQGGWPASGFGVRLRLLREGAGLNQSQLAETAGTTQATVARLEAGQQEPAWPLVLALAEALSATPNDFRPREGDARPGPAKRGRPPKAPPAAPAPPPAEDLEGQAKEPKGPLKGLGKGKGGGEALGGGLPTERPARKGRGRGK
jgi:transcriptional regulator with XRE-family HTH domain